MIGIKETKELLVGANELGLFVVLRAKDGVDFSDGVAFYEKLMSDPDFKAKIVAAYEGYNAIPDEVKDLSVGEVAELAGVQITYLPKFIEAIHG